LGKKEKEKGCARGLKTRNPFRDGLPRWLAHNILLTLEDPFFLVELIFLFLDFPGVCLGGLKLDNLCKSNSFDASTSKNGKGHVAACP